MKNFICPNCYSVSLEYNHTDWNHIDNSTGQVKPVSIMLCLDCETLFIDE